MLDPSEFNRDIRYAAASAAEKGFEMAAGRIRAPYSGYLGWGFDPGEGISEAVCVCLSENFEAVREFDFFRVIGSYRDMVELFFSSQRTSSISSGVLGG